MAGEVMTPLLPCADIDAVSTFYQMLGFEQTYRQVRPNPYLALQRDDIGLGFFGMPGFDPADSYGSCLVTVPDIGALFASFAARMRAAHGKLLVSGTPRMTRPRKRKNSDGLTGFLVVDPGGNWIRFLPQSAAPGPSTAAPTRLRRALDDAVVIADSHGDTAQAAKILDGTLGRLQDTASAVDLVDALAYRAELAVRLEDPATAHTMLDRIGGVALTDAERATMTDALDNVDELHRILNSPAPTP